MKVRDRGEEANEWKKVYIETEEITFPPLPILAARTVGLVQL